MDRYIIDVTVKKLECDSDCNVVNKEMIYNETIISVNQDQIEVFVNAARTLKGFSS